MKSLILQSLDIVNFKGQTFTLKTKGKNVDIFGDNATGKTTLYDAVCFLLFGKDSSFKADFEIKNLDPDGTAQHNLSHEVKGLFKWDGKVIELRKDYSEIWTKKRGTVTAEFSGHTTDHYIDSVPKSKREYQDYISTIATEEQFKLLTNPFYFPQIMKWSDRRGLLLSMVGDISIEDIISGNESLSALPGVLNGRDIDDHKKVITSRRKEINEKLKVLPARIDEVSKGMDDVSGINTKLEIKKTTDLTAELEIVKERIRETKNGGNVQGLKNDLSAAETVLINARNSARTIAQGIQTDKKFELDDLEIKKVKLQGRRDATVDEIEHQKESAASLEKWLSDLRVEFKGLGKLTTDTVCPTCGQDLPADQLEELRAKHNEKISIRKSEINREGKTKADRLGNINAKISSLHTEVVAFLDEMSTLAADITKMQGNPVFQEGYIQKSIGADPEVKAAQSAVEKLKSSIEKAAAGNTDESSKIIEELEVMKSGIEAKISDCQARIAKVEASFKATDRKAELEKEQKTIAAEFEKLEGELFLIDQFTRAKVDTLEDKINGMFSMARFRMFEEAINGGLAECCKVTYNGVPFESSLNNGARINVGLDIINTISKHHDFAPCVFIDNAESVTVLPDMESQVIRLVVSEHDKTLRVEVA